MEQLTQDYIRGVIEAILFISEKPVALEQFKEVIGSVPSGEIKKCIHEIIKEYDQTRRGMCIVEIAGGYQMLSSSHYASYVREFFKTRVKEKLTRPSLETLAIIAYKQPVSRADIEMIRGVNSDGVTTHLMNKGLIKIVGRKDVPGRPYLYGTTKLFLEYFGLKSLSDLPKLEDISILNLEEAVAAPPVEGVPEETAAQSMESIQASDREQQKDFGREEASLQPSDAVEENSDMSDESDRIDENEDSSRMSEEQEAIQKSASVDEEEMPVVESPNDLKQAMESINRGETPEEPVEDERYARITPEESNEYRQEDTANEEGLDPEPSAAVLDEDASK